MNAVFLGSATTVGRKSSCLPPAKVIRAPQTMGVLKILICKKYILQLMFHNLITLCFACICLTELFVWTTELQGRRQLRRRQQVSEGECVYPTQTQQFSLKNIDLRLLCTCSNCGCQHDGDDCCGSNVNKKCWKQVRKYILMRSLADRLFQHPHSCFTCAHCSQVSFFYSTLIACCFHTFLLHKLALRICDLCVGNKW